MINQPNSFVILKIVYKDEVIYKILGGWSGGYLHGDSWKLNSGIVSYNEDGDSIYFKGHSGSVYQCYKQSEQMTMIMASVFKDMTEGIMTKLGVSVELIKFEDFKNEY